MEPQRLLLRVLGFSGVVVAQQKRDDVLQEQPSSDKVRLQEWE
jgi:hypothetical protein